MSHLRPQKLDDIIGQDNVVQTLKIAIKSANIRNDALSHCLIQSASGMGKSTLAYAVANELGVEAKTILGGNIHSFKDILPTVAGMKERQVLFIDEVHRVTKRIAESFYTILEDFRVDFIKKKKEEIESIDLPRFTVIGATTESGNLPEPLRNRFQLRLELQLYSVSTLSKLLAKNIIKLGVQINTAGILAIAKASRGTPRIANGLLEWVRDYGLAKGLKSLSERNVEAAIALQGIGPDGSTENDRRYLSFLRNQKRAVGLSTLVSSLNMDRETILHVIEPFLLRKQLIQRTSKGRIIV